MKSLLLAVSLGALGAWAWTRGDTIPDSYLPWRPLNVADAPGPWAAWKLARLGRDRELCLDFLTRALLTYRAEPDRTLGAGCDFQNVVRIDASSGFNSAFALRCETAAALALWLEHDVQPSAELLLGSPVARIDHLGSYACRNVYGRAQGRRSEHATANALDVAAFRLEDGRRITVAQDWSSQNAEGTFLRAVGRGACRWFNAVLSPDDNRAHSDHFHLDRGAFHHCGARRVELE